MKKIEVMVPSNLDRSSISTLLTEVIDEEMNPKADRIDFNLSGITFINPAGMTAFLNLCYWLSRTENVSASFLHISEKENKIPRNKSVMAYMADSGFFKLFTNNDNLYKVPQLRTTTLPMKLLFVKESYGWKKGELKYWLQRTTQTESEFSNVQVAIDEIFNNISDHSMKDNGCVFAQFYPRNREIIISISDFGIGIPNSVRPMYPELEDYELLEKATEEGVSMRSSPGNRGAGLNNIIRSLTNCGIGTVYIHSNYGIIEYKDKQIVTRQESEGYYPGTFFEIRIDIDNPELYENDEEEEFEW